MKYAIDQIVDNIVVLENIETGEIKKLEKNSLPDNILEGNILVETDDGFYVDSSSEEIRRQAIQEKMDRLKALKSKES